MQLLKWRRWGNPTAADFLDYFKMTRSIKKNFSFVCDIEGCLSPGKGRALNLREMHKIQDLNKRAKKNGQMFLTLSTGRPQPFVEAIAQMLGVVWPCVCENGAFLYDLMNDRLIQHPSITNKHLNGLKSLRSLLSKEVMKIVPHKVEPGKEICISLNPIGLPSDYPHLIDSLFQEVIKYIDQDVFYITHSATAVDITPIGIDKAAGVRFLSDITKVPLEEMVGIGDTQGDLPFLRIVGQAAAPANAHNEVKKEVQYISPYQDVLGVLDIVKQFRDAE